jgi:arginyl-tRNA--protein-N-Asp/Glu arginylyltransferase
MIDPTRLPPLRLMQYEHPCSYLPGRTARMQFAWSSQMPSAYYEVLLHHGFRRSGCMVYRPTCATCRECQSIRVLANEFRPNRSMRRCWSANQDLKVEFAEPRLSPTKIDLYRRYLESRHERDPAESPEDFLYQSPVPSGEITFSLHDRPICVAIVDHIPSGLSAVYTYFDPNESARGLGTFAVLWELDYCRRNGLPYLYLGYYVRECRKMNYKIRFEPYEIRQPSGVWSRHPTEQSEPDRSSPVQSEARLS